MSRLSGVGKLMLPVMIVSIIMSIVVVLVYH